MRKAREGADRGRRDGRVDAAGAGGGIGRAGILPIVGAGQPLREPEAGGRADVATPLAAPLRRISAKRSRQISSSTPMMAADLSSWRAKICRLAAIYPSIEPCRSKWSGVMLSKTATLKASEAISSSWKELASMT